MRRTDAKSGIEHDAGGEPRGPAEPVRLLVVDDDRVDRMAVRRHLAATGIEAEISEAEGVLDAIAQLGAARFDCVLLDFNLPDGDGLTFLRGMRAAGLSVPIVMLTGQSDPQTAVDLVVSGAADYIPKDTLTPERLRESLRAALAAPGRAD